MFFFFLFIYLFNHIIINNINEITELFPTSIIVEEVVKSLDFIFGEQS